MAAVILFAIENAVLATYFATQQNGVAIPFGVLALVATAAAIVGDLP